RHRVLLVPAARAPACHSPRALGDKLSNQCSLCLTSARCVLTSARCVRNQILAVVVTLATENLFRGADIDVFIRRPACRDERAVARRPDSRQDQPMTATADLQRLINGFRLSQAVHVAAVLGISDLLAD